MNAPFRQPLASLQRPNAALHYLARLFSLHDLRQEHFCAVFLDRGRRVLGEHFVTGGGHGFVSFRMREVIGHALIYQAHGMVIAHNHPSGQCRPSGRDVIATQRLSDICRALDIELLDHFIVTENRAYSMRAREEV